MPAPRLCARCGWMLPHGPEVCRHPKGPLPHSHKAHGRLQDLAFDDHLHGIRVNGRFRHLGLPYAHGGAKSNKSRCDWGEICRKNIGLKTSLKECMLSAECGRRMR